MRNLKKALCLTLACVMLLGMMVVGTGASYDDFTDSDKIDHEEAVATLVELGVIAGKEDGSYFDPDGIITRFEMAKLICSILNGGREPAIGTKDVPTYGDIKGTWGEAYVEWCSTLNIVAGDGAGNFNGTRTVTGSEAAKMLLCALGYKADVEGYVGAAWEMNTNVRANQLDIFDEVSFSNPSLGLTRDDAAQMVFNAIKCKEVYYDNAVVVGGVTIGNSQLKEYGYSLLSKRFGVTEIEGVVVANENGYIDTNSDLQDKGYTEIYGKDVNDSTATDDYVSVKVSTAYDIIGKKVTVYVKDYKNGSYSKMYGQPIVASGITVVTYTKDFDSQTDFTSDLSKKGIKSSSAEVMFNFEPGTDLTATYGVDLRGGGITLADAWNVIGNGIEVTFINNDENNTTADYIIVKALSVGKITTYNTKGNSGDGYYTISDPVTGSPFAAGMAGLKGEDIVGIENVAKDDIVLFYLLDGKYYVEKADMVTVTPTSKQGNDVKVGSTVYKGSYLVSEYDENNNTKLSDAVSNGKDADLYLDQYGYVVFAEATSSTKNYVLITGVDGKLTSGFQSLTIKGVLQDGTKVTKSVDTVRGESLSKYFAHADTDTLAEVIDDLLNGLFSFTTTSSGDYKLKDDNVELYTGADITEVSKNTATLSATLKADSKTVFVVKDGDNYRVYTGISNVNKFTGATTHIVKDGGTAVLVYAVGSVVLDGASSNYVYLLSDDPEVSEDEDGNEVYTYDAIVNGVITTIEADDNSYSAGLYCYVSLSADGEFEGTGAAGVDVTLVAVEGLSNGNITGKGFDAATAKAPFASSTTFTYNDSTKVFIINENKGTAEDGSVSDIIYISGNAAASSRVYIIGGTTSGTRYVAQTIYVINP